jgi:predicted acyltransferase
VSGGVARRSPDDFAPPGSPMAAVSPEPNRILSLDQFRGYTVLGMFLVNFISDYNVVRTYCPTLKHHHTYCDYADTIMPHFFFAVGFALRLTLLRRLQRDGARGAYVHVVRRCLGLMLLGVVVYHLTGGVKSWSELQQLGVSGWLGAFKRNPFQTLFHIGVTSLWVLPVIAAGPIPRVAFAIACGALHAYLSAGLSGWPFHIDWSYYEWVNANPKGIDGGPLGFLTWTIPLLTGSLAYDVVFANPRNLPLGRLMGWGAVLMILGYGLSCLNAFTSPNSASLSDPGSWLIEPPFVPPSRPVNMWNMSQRSGAVSYLVFASGLSLAVYALFVLACDRAGWQLGIFGTLGGNALAAYIIHDMVDGAIKPYAPNDAPWWFVLAAFGLFVGICYMMLCYMEKHRLFLRL